MTQKPSEGAMRAGDCLYSDLEAGGTRLLSEEAGHIIDREAVAPAVRELVEALVRLATPEAFHVAQSIDGKLAQECVMRMEFAEQAVAPYRHLLTEEVE